MPRALVAPSIAQIPLDLDFKQSVRLATTGNITLSGLQTIDGFLTASGERVLVKDQTTGSQNGIYVASAGAWTRASDADSSEKVTSGMFIYVQEGTTLGITQWVLSTDDTPPIVLGTTSLSFTQVSGSATISAGDGLIQSGANFHVVGNADGSIIANANDVQVGILASDTQHGVRGGGTQHALSSAVLNGFMSASDFSKLAGLPSSAVPTSRTLTTGAGLTGGGDLSADRTFDVVANADGSIIVNANDIQVGILASDTQHGVRGGDTQHAVVVAAGAAGFMTGADKTKLDGLPSSAVPTTRALTAGAGMTGGGDLSADRTFDVVANADGSIIVNANDIQVGILASDTQHGVRGGGTQHAVVVAAGAAGFMTGADKTKLDSLTAGASVSGSGTATQIAYWSTGSAITSNAAMTFSGTAISLAPSAAITLTAGAASTWSTTTGALTLTSAAATTWSTTVGALTLTSAAAATWSTTAGTLTLNGGGGTLALQASGSTVQSLSANATTFSGTTFQMSLSGTTSNRINWGSAGTAAPTFTTYSAGVKQVLFDSVAAANAGYTIGIESGFQFYTTSISSSAVGYKWYGGITNLMTLTGGTTPTLVLDGSVSGRVKTGLTGLAAPTFTTYSAGVKYVVHDSLTASSVGFTVGIEVDTGGYMFHTAGTSATTSGFKWYGGVTELARFSGGAVPIFQVNMTTGTQPISVDRPQTATTLASLSVLGLYNTNTTNDNYVTLTFGTSTPTSTASAIARIGAQVTNHVEATKAADLIFTTFSAGTEAEKLRITGAGVVKISTGGSSLSFTGATNNRATWGTSGSAVPAFTTYSNGVKLVLSDTIAAADAGYTIGIESNFQFQTVATSSATVGYKWYGGTTQLMSLVGGTTPLLTVASATFGGTGTALTVTNTASIGTVSTTNIDSASGITVGTSTATTLQFGRIGQNTIIYSDGLGLGGVTPTDTLSIKEHSAFTGSESNTTTNAVQTTNATQTTLHSKTLADNTLYWVTAEVIGRDTGGTDRAYYSRTVLVYRQAAGAATIEGAVISLGAIETVGATAWDTTFTVSGNDVRASVTGAAATTINWTCTVRYQAVSGST